MTNEELKTATVFDLTDDSAILEDITGIISHVDGDKAFYIQNATPEAKAMDMLTYAEITENKALISRLKEVFGGLPTSLFNE